MKLYRIEKQIFQHIKDLQSFSFFQNEMIHSTIFFVVPCTIIKTINNKKKIIELREKFQTESP